jgi:RNA-binding protein YhbY
LVAEIKKQIEIRELVKIKILKNAFGEKDKDQIIEELLSKTGTALIHKVGFVIVVGKKE